ncbi:hypothetical protein ACLBXX_02705 [Microbacterium sp. C23T]
MTPQNPDAEPDPGREERRQREREARRRYRDAHADQMREYKRAWRERNAAHIREYRAAYDAAHPEVKRAEARRYAEKKRQERRRKQARQVSSKKYYEANKAQHHEYTRQWRLRKLAADPEGYRAARAVIQRRWYEKHRDERNAKLRAEHRENPELKRAAARAYYAAHAEEQKAKRRAYYAANREKVLASNRAWKDREKRRRDAGLPPRRLHTTPAAERRANKAAADEFFSRVRVAEEIAALRRPPTSVDSLRPTPPELVAALERDNQRARIEHAVATDFTLASHRRAAEARRWVAAKRPSGRELRAAAEDARMDAIGKQVNDRLRHRDPPRRPHHLDPAAPHPMLNPNTTMGMNR